MSDFAKVTEICKSKGIVLYSIFKPTGVILHAKSVPEILLYGTDIEELAAEMLPLLTGIAEVTPDYDDEDFDDDLL